jgi:hypothetical protein
MPSGSFFQSSDIMSLVILELVEANRGTKAYFVVACFPVHSISPVPHAAAANITKEPTSHFGH